ncbi:hypothetical protein KC19_VG287500 [Ceratodon purpureus]|uniref:Uncharacterized protein n=1 Tax=Ceratodon purpureus TaxID=3225 RepID=A0A8T0HVC9_CERPU|nr:hypothetical protein KC19_VG287500 [Ceratodon purpureus]
MKQSYDVMSLDCPQDMPELQMWLRRVQIFEEVNWDAVLSDYCCLKELAVAGTYWEWSPACNTTYHNVVQQTGILHAHGLLHFPPLKTTSTYAAQALARVPEATNVDCPDGVDESTARADEDFGYGREPYIQQ